jgi:hypothetical protein
VDITAVEPRKRAACFAHESQQASTGFYPKYHAKMHQHRGMESDFGMVQMRPISGNSSDSPRTCRNRQVGDAASALIP